jgi:hypothetical protein
MSEFYELHELLANGRMQELTHFTSQTSKAKDPKEVRIYRYKITPSQIGHCFIVYGTPDLIEIEDDRNGESILVQMKETIPHANEVVQRVSLRDTCRSMDLTRAKEQIERLNEMLHTGCPNLTLSLETVYDPKNQDKFINSYSLDLSELLLCLYEGNSCVASITIMVRPTNNIYIDSFTNNAYRNLGLNNFLRAVAILISKQISPSIERLTSYAINPVSALLLLKNFGGVPLLDVDPRYSPMENQQNQQELMDILGEDFANASYEKIKQGMNKFDGFPIIVELDESHLDLAQRQFDTFVQRRTCSIPNAAEPTVGGRKKSGRQKKSSTRKKYRRRSTRSSTRRR